MAAHARDSGSSIGNTSSQPGNQLAIQVNDDRMTLAVAKVPQVYLYGVIDADAPNRLGALIKSGKIRAGSDIYLNAIGGDIDAGMALGKLFRAASLGTHLGVPRRTARSPAGPRAAQCIDACVYAYVGGLYRWAPTGNDRMGAQARNVVDAKTSQHGAAPAPADDKTTYLTDMGIRPESLAPTPTASPDDVIWLNGDQMIAMGVANNGRLPPEVTYRPTSGSTYLSFSQTARDGEHRITLLCRPDGLTLTAYYMIGAERSKKIAARVTHSYFEIDQQPTSQTERGDITAINQSLVFSHPVPMDQLARLLSAHSMGAWLADRGGAVRYGFAIDLDGAKAHLNDYNARCNQLAKLPSNGKTAGT
ncbi:hypothetical protein [Dyella sp. 20L07]|uniref:hypothetical protein n=1 Tax=Dyella sp. 20L07 TaxID=3384240 RepID=UPI003D2B0B44